MQALVSASLLHWVQGLGEIAHREFVPRTLCLVGSIDNLVDTLLAVREAIVTGELDAQIEAASGAVRADLKKK